MLSSEKRYSCFWKPPTTSAATSTLHSVFAARKTSLLVRHSSLTLSMLGKRGFLRIHCNNCQGTVGSASGNCFASLIKWFHPDAKERCTWPTDVCDFSGIFQCLPRWSSPIWLLIYKLCAFSHAHVIDQSAKFRYCPDKYFYCVFISLYLFFFKFIFLKIQSKTFSIQSKPVTLASSSQRET